MIHEKTNIGEVHLNVQNLDKSVAFYQKVIGFQILKKEEQKVWLTADGRKALLVLHEEADFINKPAQTIGLYHFAILLPTRKDLADIAIHLVNSGIQLGASDHGFSEALYFNDLDNNGIEIYADKPKEVWYKNGGLPAVSDPINFPDLMKVKSNEDWSLLPEGTTMGHIHLHVDNLQRAKEFYVDGLGFDIKTKMSDHALFIAAADYHHHIGLNIWAGKKKPPVNAVGLKYYTIEVVKEEYDRLVKKLNEMNVLVSLEENGALFSDPADNKIMLAIK